MARVIVELMPNTLVLKSRISNDEISSGSASGFALINQLDIDCPKEKSLGIDVNDYINSWCSVHLEVYVSAKKLGDYDLPDTRAKLFRHSDGHGVVMEEYPGGGFTLYVSLGETDYEKIIATTNNPHFRITVECNAWLGHGDDDSTIFAEQVGTWCTRFETIELRFGEAAKERWPFAGLISRKHAEFKTTIPKELRINRFDFSYYLAKSVGCWAMSKPVSRNSVVTELDEAFEMAKNIRDWSALEVESEIDRYINKPWATSSYFERKLLQSLVYERIDELLLEIQNPQHTFDVATLRSRYRIADIPKVQKYGAAINLLIGIALGIVVSISNGWGLGIFAGFVYLSIADIKVRIDRVRFPKPGDGYAALIRDLEHTKQMCWRAEERKLCPRYIRQRLEEMEDRGVGWYAGTLDIVRHAETRNPNIWE